MKAQPIQDALQKQAVVRPSLKELLLSGQARTGQLAPQRPSGQNKVRYRRVLNQLEYAMPTTMTLTGKGQFTFNKSLLEHLGVKAGEQVVVEKQTGGTLSVKSAKKRISAKSLVGILKTEVRLGDEELKKAIENAHAKAGIQGLQ